MTGDSQEARRARSIIEAIEKEFSGVKLTAEFLRRIIHHADGVLIGPSAFDPGKGTIECTIRVDRGTNYDAVYRCVVRVLECQDDYEPRGGSAGFTLAEEDMIEQMPAEGDVDPSETLGSQCQDTSSAARNVLYGYMHGRYMRR